jgi:hypothetical protein
MLSRKDRAALREIAEALEADADKLDQNIIQLSQPLNDR